MKNIYLQVLKKVTVFVLITFGMFLSVAAAAGFYSTNMQYGAEKAVIPEYLKAGEKTRGAIISIAEFTDKRQLDDTKIIGQVRERDDTRVSVFTRGLIPGRAVANGIKHYLKKAGYNVADRIVQWDLKRETMPKGNAKVIISGTIDSMEVTCWRGVFSHSYKTKIKLTIILAAPAKGKMLYKRKVESTSSKNGASFSEGEMGGQLSAALGDAIENAFEDKEVAQEIKEAITK